MRHSVIGVTSHVLKVQQLNQKSVSHDWGSGCTDRELMPALCLLVKVILVHSGELEF